MKLPQLETSLDLQLLEFDNWITASTGEIQDTEKFKNEASKIFDLLINLEGPTNKFESKENCKASAIANTCINLIESKFSPGSALGDKELIAFEIIDSLYSLLFVVTGKSDNNLKCQFPVYLFQEIHRTTFPHKAVKRGEIAFVERPLGRTIKSEKVAKLVSDCLSHYSENADLAYLDGEARWLLEMYISAILKDEASVEQFWAFGNSFFNLRAISAGSEKALIAPITIFKVRGSVSASGGHIPEDILRGMMDQWGMERGVDYNTEDIIVGDQKEDSKSRAYDFVLPYKSEGWGHEIFIQCQFYAGDSGSVSHKVVDQTAASRPLTQAVYPNARFVEYLDGAGYYASLNTDLQHMLRMQSTKSFIQIRSAHIKLRREFQEIGYLLPLELEQILLRDDASAEEDLFALLNADGYSEEEIRRVLARSIQRQLLQMNEGRLEVSPHRIEFARRSLLLDLVAIRGERLASEVDVAGKVLVSGYGPFYGISLADLSGAIPAFSVDSLFSRDVFSSDITWLCEMKFLVLR